MKLFDKLIDWCFEEKKVEKKKEKKKNETPTNDFLSGTADNKKSHIRGRTK